MGGCCLLKAQKISWNSVSTAGSKLSPHPTAPSYPLRIRSPFPSTPWMSGNESRRPRQTGVYTGRWKSMGVRTSGLAGRRPGRKQSGAWTNSAETHERFGRQSWNGTRCYGETPDEKALLKHPAGYRFISLVIANGLQTALSKYSTEHALTIHPPSDLLVRDNGHCLVS